MTAPSRPLIIAEDDELIDDLVRITAAAGTSAIVASDVGAAASSWSRAQLVLIGASEARSPQAATLRRRSGVIVVTRAVAAEPDVDARVWKDAVAIGAEHVVALPEGETWLVERLAASHESPDRAGRFIGVTGVCGGAGASTFTVALACAIARTGLRTVVIDGDRLGGGLDLAFGIEYAEGMRWPEFAEVQGRLSADAFHTALPIAFGVSVLSWDRRRSAPLELATVTSVLDAASRAFDVVLIDAPRESMFSEWIAEFAGDIVAMVPTRVRSVSAALQVLDRFNAANVHVVAQAHAPLDDQDVADVLGRAVVAVVKDEEAVAKRVEQGDPPGTTEREPIAKAAASVLAALHLAA